MHSQPRTEGDQLALGEAALRRGSAQFWGIKAPTLVDFQLVTSPNWGTRLARHWRASPHAAQQTEQAPATASSWERQPREGGALSVRTGVGDPILTVTVLRDPVTALVDQPCCPGVHGGARWTSPATATLLVFKCCARFSRRKHGHLVRSTHCRGPCPAQHPL